MAQHVMIDFETLDTRLDCVILTIGACVFDPRGSGVLQTVYIKPDVDEQIAMGRSVDEGTLNWWGTQNQQAQDEAFGEEGRIPFHDALEQLNKLCWNKERVWSNGAAFDIAILEFALKNASLTVPWKFWEVRDTRTLWEVAGVRLNSDGGSTSHRADDDAIKQAAKVQEAYKKLSTAGFLQK